MFFAYAVVTVDSVELFVQKSQLTEDALKFLGDPVNIQPYDGFFNYLKGLPNTLKLNEEAVCDNTLNLSRTNLSFCRKFLLATRLVWLSQNL